MDYSAPDGTKVLVATPNYMNMFNAEAHTSHVACAMAWTEWGIDFTWSIIGRSFVHFARTQMCHAAVDGKFTHILWLDDDAVIDPEILPRFLTHDKNVVIAPYCLRKMPYEIGVLRSDTGDFHDHTTYKNLTLSDMDQGLIQVDGGGTHCMLIKVDTLHKQGPSIEEAGLGKGFSSFMEEDLQGHAYFIMPKAGTEDMYWCYRSKLKGIEIWCDTDSWADHVGFTPVITKSYRQHVEDHSSEWTETIDTTKMTIIPGSTGLRNPTEIRTGEANLI